MNVFDSCRDFVYQRRNHSPRQTFPPKQLPKTKNRNTESSHMRITSETIEHPRKPTALRTPPPPPSPPFPNSPIPPKDHQHNVHPNTPRRVHRAEGHIHPTRAATRRHGGRHPPNPPDHRCHVVRPKAAAPALPDGAHASARRRGAPPPAHRARGRRRHRPPRLHAGHVPPRHQAPQRPQRRRPQERPHARDPRQQDGPAHHLAEGSI